jgi:hypothetical protein
MAYDTRAAVAVEAGGVELPPVKRGLGLVPCPLCGQEEATIDLCLADGAFRCQDCEGDFGVEEIHLRITKWQKLLALHAVLPVLEG